MRISSLRYPLFAAVILMMFAGGWAALQRSGWALPMLRPSLVGIHGPLMIGGVFGALIALERAVALAALLRSPRHPSFLVPMLAGLGGILLILDGSSPLARWSLLCASLGLVIVYVSTATKHHYWSRHTVIMCLGAAMRMGGNVFWTAGYPVYVVVHLWMGFIVLTIVGERLELSRVMRLSRRTERLLMGAVAIYIFGALFALVNLNGGVRAAGTGGLLIALWLVRYDVASKRLRHRGLTRYIAVCLFMGYLWMGFSGVLALVFGGVYTGFQYDAIIHAIVGGFIFSMVFGHASMIFPALTGLQIKFTRTFYVPLVMLHCSIGLREVSNLASSFEGRMWAGMINAAAVVLFGAVMAYSAVRFAHQIQPSEHIPIGVQSP